MGRYMVELGLTPASRSRMMSDVSVPRGVISAVPLTITRVIVDAPAETLQDRWPRQLTSDEWMAEHGGDDD